MLRKFTSFSKRYRTDNIYNTYNLQACTITIDADTLTALISQPVLLTARVDPPETYDVNFRANGDIINPVPIPTDPSGMVTLPLDTTGQPPGLYDLIAEVVGPIPTSCVSSPLIIALTTTLCTGIVINNPSPITTYIGDIIPASATATIVEQSIIEFVDSATNMRFGSCIATPPSPSQCTVNIDTTGAPPGTYSVVAKIGNGPAQQCISTPVEAILQERPGKIVVISIPPGARIYYDSVDTGINSSAIISDVVPNISHEIKLILAGYQDYIESSIILSPGSTASIFAMLVPETLPTGIGNLNVTSVPDGVEFGLYTGETDIAPVTLYDIPAGINAYEAGLTGYNGAMGSFTIKDGETTNINIPLQPYTPDMGMVAIESIPMGADIYIDGSPINTKTSFMTLMTPGIHTYELRLSGYQNKSGTFTVVTGYDMPTIVSDILQPSGTGTAMIFVMVGIAALGMMITSPSSVGIKEEGVK